MESESDRRADVVLKTNGTNSMGFKSSTLRQKDRYSKLRGRYYLSPIINKLIKEGLSITKISELLDCSRSTINYAKDSIIEKFNNTCLDEIFGEIDNEYLREEALYECCKFLISRGWQIGLTDPKCVYDVFATKNNETIKIQVRSSSGLSARNWPTFKTCNIRYNIKEMKRTQYKPEDFDYWFFYSKSGDKWIIPFSEITTSSVVSVEGYDDFFIG